MFYLGDGRGLASGFYQAIVLSERGPTLNINNTFCCFYQNYNLVEFLSCYLNNDIRKHGKKIDFRFIETSFIFFRYSTKRSSITRSKDLKIPLVCYHSYQSNSSIIV
jgi:hypothetical protein